MLETLLEDKISPPLLDVHTEREIGKAATSERSRPGKSPMKYKYAKKYINVYSCITHAS